MFDSLNFRGEVKLFLKNELRQNKDAGTYLFYGDKGIDLLGLATSFTMAMNCPELELASCPKFKQITYPGPTCKNGRYV